MEKRKSMIREPEFRAKRAEDDDKLYLEGYFIRYNEETELYDGVFEEIAPEAVEGSLLSMDIRALFNHDDNTVLGRTSNKTLKLKSDRIGLHGTIEINQDDAEAMNIYSRVQRGDISACSFGFYPLDEEYTDREDGSTHIKIKNMQLLEVSPVTFPAYPKTSVAARNKDIRQHKKKFNERKKKLLERVRNK